MISDTGTPHRAAAPQSPLEKVGAFLASLDKLQLGMALFLCAVGLVFIRSTGMQANRGAASFWRQLFWMGAGLAVYILCAIPDPRKTRFKVTAFLVYPVTVMLLVMFDCTCSISACSYIISRMSFLISDIDLWK